MAFHHPACYSLGGAQAVRLRQLSRATTENRAGFSSRAVPSLNFISCRGKVPESGIRD
jgi:hypothetical protein